MAVTTAITPGVSFRARRVDPPDDCPGVGGEHERSVEQAGTGQVVDEGAIAEGGANRVVTCKALADATILQRGRDRLASTPSGHQLDSVDDLLVSRTPAQVLVDGAGDVGPRRMRVLIKQVLGAERDSRDTEAALHAGGRDERPRKQIPVGLGEPFESEDLSALDRPGGHRACDLGVSVDERQAAPALALRRATILERPDAAALAQRLEQGLVRARLHPHLRAVQEEFDAHSATRSGATRRSLAVPRTVQRS